MLNFVHKGIIAARHARTSRSNAQGRAARVRPGLAPRVLERLRVLAVVVLPRCLVAGDSAGDAAENVRLSDGDIVRPPPNRVSLECITTLVTTYW